LTRVRASGGRSAPALLLACLLAFAAGPAAHAATITVNSSADTEMGNTLRNAIESINNGGDGPSLTSTGGFYGTNDTILFAGSVHTINLSLGELTTTKAMRIDGPGPASLTVNGPTGANQNRVLENTASGVTISGLTIAGGHAVSRGGGVLNSGGLTLRNVVVTNNHAADGGPVQDGSDGGGIYNTAALTVIDSTISANSAGAGDAPGQSPTGLPGFDARCPDFANGEPGSPATDGGPGAEGDPGKGGGGGGAIANVGDGSAVVTVRGSTITGNHAGAGGDGGSGGDGGEGGQGADCPDPEPDRPPGNRGAPGSGGDGGPGGLGGGIANFSTGVNTFSKVEVSNSTFEGNQTGQPGAAGAPGFGIGSAPREAVDGDQGVGGAVFNNGTTSLFNDTITHNAALTSANPGQNSPTGGGALWQSSGQSFVVDNTIASENGTAPQCGGAGAFFFGGDISWPDASCGGANQNPLLDPAGLQDNGGPTKTIKLQSGSPAINGAPACGDSSGALTVDQRDDLSRWPRPGVGKQNCDIGAFETQGTPALIINQFRFQTQANQGDAFVQIYNPSNSPMPLGGWTLQASNGQVLSLSGSIDGHGSHLVVGPGYTLGMYEAGDELLGFSIPGAGGVTLRDPGGALEDKVGFTPVDPAFRFGAGLAVPGGLPSTTHLAWVRKKSAGDPVNTLDNFSDFLFIADAQNDAPHGSPAFGTAGPSRSTSPIVHNDILQSGLFDTSQGQGAAPNREFVAGAPGLGVLYIRRTVTNASATQEVTRLRFRITDLSTVNHTAGAQLQAIDAPGGNFTVGGGTKHAFGLPIDQGAPGGIDSTLTATSQIPGGLAPHESMSVEFAFRVYVSGPFTFAYNAEDDLAPAKQGEGGTPPASTGDGADDGSARVSGAIGPVSSLTAAAPAPAAAISKKATSKKAKTCARTKARHPKRTAKKGHRARAAAAAKRRTTCAPARKPAKRAHRKSPSRKLAHRKSAHRAG
jgi:hypothetical protein